MSLQSIINISNSLTIDRRRMVGIQFARNELPRVSETPTFNPWKFEVSVPSSLRYNEARQILESLDRIDRTTPEDISFSDSTINWMFAYQGTLTPTQRSQVTFSSFTNNQLVLDVSQVVGATIGSIVVQEGDFIQIQGYPFPFTSRTEVLRGSGSTVTVTTHRPNIFSTNPTVGTQLNWGNDVIFKMFCQNMPTYKLIPGGAVISKSGVISNNALIEWGDNFKLFEWVAGA